MITCETAATVLGVHVNTVRRLIESGRLRGVNIGTRRRRHWRIVPDDLAEFVGAGGHRG